MVSRPPGRSMTRSQGATRSSPIPGGAVLLLTGCREPGPLDRSYSLTTARAAATVMASTATRAAAAAARTRLCGGRRAAPPVFTHRSPSSRRYLSPSNPATIPCSHSSRGRRHYVWRDGRLLRLAPPPFGCRCLLRLFDDHEVGVTARFP